MKKGTNQKMTKNVESIMDILEREQDKCISILLYALEHLLLFLMFIGECPARLPYHKKRMGWFVAPEIIIPRSPYIPLTCHVQLQLFISLMHRPRGPTYPSNFFLLFPPTSSPASDNKPQLIIPHTFLIERQPSCLPQGHPSPYCPSNHPLASLPFLHPHVPSQLESVDAGD